MVGAPLFCGVLLDVDVEDAAGGLQFAVGVAVVGALAAVDGDPFPDFGAGADRDDAGVGEGRAALAVDDDPVALGFELADGLLRVVACGGGGDGGGGQSEDGGESGGWRRRWRW